MFKFEAPIVAGEQLAEHLTELQSRGFYIRQVFQVRYLENLDQFRIFAQQEVEELTAAQTEQAIALARRGFNYQQIAKQIHVPAMLCCDLLKAHGLLKNQVSR